MSDSLVRRSSEERKLQTDLDRFRDRERLVPPNATKTLVSASLQVRRRLPRVSGPRMRIAGGPEQLTQTVAFKIF
jgi:hypothetical protein